MPLPGGPRRCGPGGVRLHGGGAERDVAAVDRLAGRQVLVAVVAVPAPTVLIRQHPPSPYRDEVAGLDPSDANGVEVDAVDAAVVGLQQSPKSNRYWKGSPLVRVSAG